MSIRAGAMGVAQEDGLVTYHYEVMRPKPGVDPRYVVYLMKSSQFTRELIMRERGIGAGSAASGVRTTEVPFSVMRTIDLELPELGEQRRIAEFLDRETAQIDELIAKQEQLISTLAEREVALITTVVGRRDSTGTHPRIGSLRRFLRSITDGAHISPETEGGLHDFVSTRDISDGEIDFEGSLKTSPETYEYMVRTGCRPRPGDILFSKDGTVGKTAVVPTGHDFVVASSLVILQPDHSAVESRFLDYVLRSHGVQAQVGLFVKGAGLPRISVANVGRLVVEVPDLDAQSLAVRVLDDSLESLTHLVMRAETAIDLLRERRQALISAAVTGQIDVGGAS